MAIMIDNWPVAEFDPVRQLRVIAAATPGASLHETIVAAPFETVWSVAADLERELQRWLFRDIRSVTVASTSDPERLVARVRGYSGMRARFDVVLRPGWCLMQSRFLVGAMAAVVDGDNTRFVFLDGFRGPLHRLGPITRPLSRRNGARALDRFTERVNQRLD
jgi:hypothetical protein